MFYLNKKKSTSVVRIINIFLELPTANGAFKVQSAMVVALVESKYGNGDYIIKYVVLHIFAER